MVAHFTHPTPYPDVNAVLHILLSSVQTILGDRFIGMYLYGSLASDDFDPQRSDIDFVVVTADELPDEILLALEAMHSRITASGLKWATKLEGSYIPQRALRRYDPTDAPCPYINEGSFRVGRQGSDWVIQRHIIREQGVVVAGPAPQTLIDPVQPNDLRRAVLGFLREWWSPMLHSPDPRLHGSEYQAYAVLTMCRALYTLQYGTVVSKSVAARWAREALGERWATLIERALSWQHDTQSDNMGETLDFIRYTLERSQQLEIPNREAVGRLCQRGWFKRRRQKP
ncbi:MAG: aminoglycoside adenylyltransferase domain-containing protein [bacterium]